MTTMTLQTIRSAFLDYFAKNGHTVVASSSLVPHNDPTLLFTNAGMVQFKDVFTGQKKAPFPRATTAQKCVRAGGKHNDLENVGYTARHHTFFEMLGNFSLGDYFKAQAIEHAWTVITKVFQLPPSRLCVTVYSEDDEAASLWKKIAGFDDSKIIRIPTTANFWSMGDTGPCGPCTEIFYDHGDSVAGGPPGSADEDGDRFIEIWNLVFMQFEQAADGTRAPLPRPCIDTGMGLERIAAVLQGKQNNFDIDLFVELERAIREKLHCPSGHEQSCHVVSDHLRAISFLVADGVLPLNEGRGYVLRRIIRRAIRHARLLGAHDPVLFECVGALVSLMGDPYKELIQHQSLIESVLKDEEERFGATLDAGLKWVETELKTLSGCVLPGDVAFRLYDTYGFPVDLTADILRPKGISVDMEGFEKAMQRQKEQSKQAGQLGIKVSKERSFEGLETLSLPATKKLCYDAMSAQGKVLWCQVDADGMGRIVLDQTPFFAESGGQVGDTGVIEGVSGSLNVSQTFKVPGQDLIIHEGKMTSGTLRVGDSVEASVDSDRRRQIAAHHSATHLLQASLRGLLGTHVTQKGSSVDEFRLRFDFTHPHPLTPEELLQVEAEVNGVILSALPARTLVCGKEEAQRLGALAFFDEKYGDEVRVVQLALDDQGRPFSQELCGGTHVTNTGQIGGFKILSESGIAAGIRRIEAVCGQRMMAWFEESLQKVRGEKEELQKELKALEKQAQKGQTAQALQSAKVENWDCGAMTLTTYDLGELPASLTRDAALLVQSKLTKGVATVSSVWEGKVMLVVLVGKESQGCVKASDLLKEACVEIVGKGGGKADMAQGGGSRPAGLAKALRRIQEALNRGEA